ncbi:sodium:solute symporter [candidate division KSB1 bacterium]
MSEGAVSAVIIVLICLVSVFSGWLAVRRRLPTAADYFTAGGVFGPFALALGIFISFVSFFGYFGLASLSYRTGLGSLSAVGLVSVFTGLLLYLVHRKTVLLARPLGWSSQGMVYGARYGRPMQFLVPLVMLLATVPYLAAQVMAIGHLCSSLGLPYWGGILFIMLFTALYVTIGGFRGSTYAHIIQGTICLVGLLLTIGAILHHYQGLSPLYQRILQTKPSLLMIGAGNPPAWHYTTILSFSLAMTLGTTCMMQPFMHAFSTNDFRAFKTWTLMIGPLIFISCGTSAWVGLVGFDLFPGLAGLASDQIYSLVLHALFPGWTAAVLLALVCGAAMATIDALLLGNAMNLINDIYKPFINPDLSDRQVVSYSRALIIAVTLIAVLLVWKPVIPIAELTVFGFSTSALMIFPLVGGYYWRRATSAGAIASLLVGIPANYILSIGLGWPRTMQMPKAELAGFSPFLAALLLTGIVFVVVSFLTSPSSKRVLDNFFAVE